MSGEISYSRMYIIGYEDAIEDLKKYLQHIYKSPSDPVSYSFNSGWNAAVDKIVEDSLKWKANKEVS